MRCCTELDSFAQPQTVGSGLVRSMRPPLHRRDCVYYSCSSSYHVHCFPPVSWTDWQQFEAATINPALPSTLKPIPLSLTQWATLMCAHARSFQLQLPTHQTHTYTVTHTLVLGNACQIFAWCVSSAPPSLR